MDMLDFLSRLVIPVVSVALSAFVSLRAIRRADQRERDKQRRDDLLKSGTEFYDAGGRAEDALNRQLSAYPVVEGDALLRAEHRLRGTQDFLALSDTFDSLEMRLDGLGEFGLSHAVNDYYKEASRTQSNFFTWLTGVNVDLNKCVALHGLTELRKKRREVAEAFIRELESLRKAQGVSFRATLQRWKDRVAECWLRL